DRAGADFVGSPRGGDPAAVAYDAIAAAESRGRDVVIVDTAGRLHTQTNLMEELAKVRRVIAQRLEGAPHETLLVVDATTGQNGLQQARLFGQAVDVSGIVLTKLDGSAKGGIAIAIAHQLRLPAKLIGIGAGPDDLWSFVLADVACALGSGSKPRWSGAAGSCSTTTGCCSTPSRAGPAPRSRSSSATATSSTWTRNARSSARRPRPRRASS